jgi:beta-xylosidase
VTEGSFIIRRGGWFYHFYSGNACCGRGCDYALGVARSRKLLGPWEKNPANPILDDNATWQCPGHGSIVTTPEGRDFLLYHAYRKRSEAFIIGREALLDEVKWGENGWPTINEGRGPSGTAPAPLEKASTRTAQTEFFDGFTSPQLDASWQWPMFSENGARIDAASGHLILVPVSSSLPSADPQTGAVLAQRTMSGNYVATTLLDARGLQGQASAGLAAYSWRNDAVGVSVGGGNIFVWRRDGKDRQTPAQAIAPSAPSIYLRMTVADGEQFRFAFSTNGRDWKELGGTIQAGNVEGAHVALIAGSGAGARFDWLKITAK